MPLLDCPTAGSAPTELAFERKVLGIAEKNVEVAEGDNGRTVGVVVGLEHLWCAKEHRQAQSGERGNGNDDLGADRPGRVCEA